MRDMANKCDSCPLHHQRRFSFPRGIEWIVVAKQWSSPSISFGFTIEASCYKHEQELEPPTATHIDNVMLRPQDRHHIQVRVNCLPVIMVSIKVWYLNWHHQLH